MIGPHSVISFANECRAHKQNIWGTWRWNPPEGVRDSATEDAGFRADMSYDFEARKIDPRMGDGLYYGPSSGHVNSEKAENVGMGGAYGYGASMNAWFLDTSPTGPAMTAYLAFKDRVPRPGSLKATSLSSMAGRREDRAIPSYGFPSYQFKVR